MNLDTWPPEREARFSLAIKTSKPDAKHAARRLGITGWGDALVGLFTVIHALLLRETRTRFGAHKLGYAWALFEPALFIGTFVAMFSVAGRQGHGEMGVFGFLATGIVPYLLFTKSTIQVSQSINGNKGLLFYPQVKPLDVVLARITLEFCTYFAVFLALMSIDLLVQRELSIADPLLIVIGFLLASLLGSSLGLVFMGLGQISNFSDRARGPLMRPFFWVSGLFFTAQEIPDEYRELVLYNPVLHVVELVRAGWYPSYKDTYVDIPYVLVWCAGLAFVGLVLESATRRKIEVS